MTVSIIIPTFNRPAFLKEAVESCLSQTCLPDEILIGDDSNDDVNKELITILQNSSPVPISYFRHAKSLKQAGNVNFLFNKVKTDFLILLHDDDLLSRDAIGNFQAALLDYPQADAIFGKQYLIDATGLIDSKESENLNIVFYRTKKYSGNVLTPLEAGMVQQFPNDGYILKTLIAQKVLYNEKIKDACDFEFGLRLGLSGISMIFIDKYTSSYRISNNSIASEKANDAAYEAYKLVSQLEVEAKSKQLKAIWLKSKAPVALAQACSLNYVNEAFRIYLSKWHRGKILTLGGINRLMMICKASIKKIYIQFEPKKDSLHL